MNSVRPKSSLVLPSTASCFRRRSGWRYPRGPCPAATAPHNPACACDGSGRPSWCARAHGPCAGCRSRWAAAARSNNRVLRWPGRRRNNRHPPSADSRAFGRARIPRLGQVFSPRVSGAFWAWRSPVNSRKRRRARYEHRPCRAALVTSCRRAIRRGCRPPWSPARCPTQLPSDLLPPAMPPRMLPSTSLSAAAGGRLFLGRCSLFWPSCFPM